jgi:hypothetical protein
MHRRQQQQHQTAVEREDKALIVLIVLVIILLGITMYVVHVLEPETQRQSALTGDQNEQSSTLRKLLIEGGHLLHL